jgi:hypothetical protein
MSMTDKQRDVILTNLAADVRKLVKHLIPDEERPAATRKKDPRRVYGGDHA